MKKLILKLEKEYPDLDLKNHTREVLFLALESIIRDIEYIRRK